MVHQFFLVPLFSCLSSPLAVKCSQASLSRGHVPLSTGSRFCCHCPRPHPAAMPCLFQVPPSELKEPAVVFTARCLLPAQEGLPVPGAMSKCGELQPQPGYPSGWPGHVPQLCGAWPQSSCPTVVHLPDRGSSTRGAWAVAFLSTARFPAAVDSGGS